MLRRAHLEIDRIAPSGDGVGACDGIVVHVAGAFGGERAVVELVHRSRQHARAIGRLVSLERAHPARRAAPCKRHERACGGCGGCPLMELDEAAQREAKRAMLASIGLEVGELVHAGPSLGYRVSSKRVVFGRRGALELGSWSRGTHEGATMDGCLVDHPLLVEAARELARAADAMGIAPFDETRGQGDLRYVWLKTDGARVLVTLVTASEDSEAARSLPQRLSLAHGVAWSVQPAKGNAMRGSAPRVLAGAPSLSVSIAGVPLEVGPLGFLQPNPAVIERAYRDLVRDEAGEATAGELAWDLYAGAGVTAALLARSFARVLACESYPESAAALGVEPCSVERFLDREAGTPALVVANPPRKGLGADVCEALARIAPPRLHVMSCGPEGLARDLAQLVRSGYRLASLTAYDTLPQTPHVELVARLIRGREVDFLTFGRKSESQPRVPSPTSPLSLAHASLPSAALLIAMLVGLGACDAAGGASDGSIADADARPAAFEVRLERSTGIPIEEGDELAAEYGCQGGAHVMFDVVATGDDLGNAEVSATALGGAITLTMSETPSGAEYRHLMLVIAELVPPRSLGLPRDETVHVSVRRRDGARVVLDRRVRLVDGEVCTVSCQYVDVPGIAHVTAIEGPGTTGCDTGEVTITYDFTPDGGDSPDVGQRAVEVLAPDCLTAMGLSVGADLPASRRDLLPGTGTCAPFEWNLSLDHDACAAACPGP